MITYKNTKITGPDGKFVQYDEICKLTNKTIDKEYDEYKREHGIKSQIEPKLKHLAFFEKQISDQTDPGELEISLKTDNVHPKYLRSDYNKLKGFDVNQVKIKVSKMLKNYSKPSKRSRKRTRNERKVCAVMMRFLILHNSENHSEISTF